MNPWCTFCIVLVILNGEALGTRQKRQFQTNDDTFNEGFENFFTNQGFQNQQFPNQGQNINQGQTSPNTQSQAYLRCVNSCPTATPEFNPVCGSNGLTYDNPSKLSCARQCGVNVNLVRMSTCSRTTSPSPLNPTSPTVNPSIAPTTEPPGLENCMQTCPRTSEYNPVCGSNGQTYNNPGTLRCAQFCGVSVNLLRATPCIVVAG